MTSNQPMPSSQQPSRSEWPALLAKVSGEAHQAAMAFVVESGYAIEPLRPSQDGFALMQVQDSCEQQPFYLGELPLAQAAVRVTTPDGRKLEGACQLLTAGKGASMAKVEAIAVWDAILADPEAHDGAVVERGQSLLAEGANELQRIAEERKAILAATKVNFKIMDE